MGARIGLSIEVGGGPIEVTPAGDFSTRVAAVSPP